MPGSWCILSDLQGFIAAARASPPMPMRRTLGLNGRSYAERAYDIHRTADRFERVRGGLAPRRA
jgi:hypothetical protein